MRDEEKGRYDRKSLRLRSCPAPPGTGITPSASLCSQCLPGPDLHGVHIHCVCVCVCGNSHFSHIFSLVSPSLSLGFAAQNSSISYSVCGRECESISSIRLPLVLFLSYTLFLTFPLPYPYLLILLHLPLLFFPPTHLDHVPSLV